MVKMSPRRLVLLAALLLSACGASEAAAPAPASGTIGGVGSLPSPLTPTTIDGSSTTTTVERSTVPVERELDEVGARTSGNRVIVIGDSILASTSERFGGEMCFALVPQHWAVEVDAESGRFVEFGNEVLDERLDPERGLDWDAAVVMLGNNLRGDLRSYESELFDILDRLAPRPTVLFTVTEFRPDRAAVNDIIRGMLRYYPQVEIADWAAATEDDPSLLSGDGLHLSDAGRAELARLTAEALGDAPITDQGDCLDTEFDDDSAVSGSGGSGTGSGSSGGVATTTPRPRTVRPTPTTTRPTTDPVIDTTVDVTQPPPTVQPPDTTSPDPDPTPTTQGGGQGGGAGGDSGDDAGTATGTGGDSTGG